MDIPYEPMGFHIEEKGFLHIYSDKKVMSVFYDLVSLDPTMLSQKMKPNVSPNARHTKTAKHLILSSTRKELSNLMLKQLFSSPEPKAHGELIVYQSSRRPSVRLSTMLKDLLLQNRLANQSQILCGASLCRRNESLFSASGSHDQDGHHAHIW